ncbi:uncharacterized protein LOC9655713 [Selaginella moellendorffii]|uniref:uncharacterized protein LOC9655713 n=1 Tax=Selaginella moellendorffii TaxID=88036 RepID=UPI000D1C3671|nr:uncharacterized protein LOC9655713 [Selaginella moellendorffii]XP_024525085.1 uncharacterized protein LOC9655713 [Selaginella moellendorffii]XP_024525086.1 uncharacterized protein LOC9655713 [Selaginella moellendorffii]|eukprot:XP_024525083.1 uncharacterized protein LOC9655713 [Selaginella moellendorffii]
MGKPEIICPPHIDSICPIWLKVPRETQAVFIDATYKIQQIGELGLHGGPPISFRLQKEHWLHLAHEFLLEKVKLNHASSTLSWNQSKQLEKLEQWNEPWFFEILGDPVKDVSAELRSIRRLLDDQRLDPCDALRGFINLHLKTEAYKDCPGAYWALDYTQMLVSQLLLSQSPSQVYHLVLDFVKDFWTPPELLDEAKAWACFYVGVGTSKSSNTDDSASWFRRSLELARSYNLLSQASEMLGDIYLGERELTSHSRKQAQMVYGIQHWAAVKLQRVDVALHALCKLFQVEFYAGNLHEAEALANKLQGNHAGGYVAAQVHEMHACINFAQKRFGEAEAASLEAFQILEQLSTDMLPESFSYFETQQPDTNHPVCWPQVMENVMESARLVLGISRLSREFSANHEGTQEAEEKLQMLVSMQGLVPKANHNALAAELVRNRATAEIYHRGDLEGGESSTAQLLDLCSKNTSSKCVRMINMTEAVSFVVELAKANAHRNKLDGDKLQERNCDSIIDSILTANQDLAWMFTVGDLLKARRRKAFRPLQREKHLLCWYQQERRRPGPRDIDNVDTIWEELEAVYKSARDDTVFLVYLWDWVYPFVELPSRSKMHSYLLNPNEEEARWHAQAVGQLYSKVYDMRRNLAEDEDIRKCLEELHQLLISPWSEELKRIQPKRLVVIPTSVVAMVPFAALLDPEDGLYLVEKYAISYSPSLRMVERFIGNKSDQVVIKQAMVVGNPDDSLESAEDEAVLVVNKLMQRGSCQVDLLLGLQGRRAREMDEAAAATRAAVMDSFSSSRWIHIAGHASINDNFPCGALHLEDGSLSMEEIEEKLRRHREVASFGVVLSGCSTALGQIEMQGITGLCRCFHEAGVSVVVASLWNVDDFETQLLVEKFYAEACKGVEIAVALQSAMKSMIHSKNFMGAPAYTVNQWAAFTVSGDLYSALSF